ncbi:MAG: hypothetical protein GX992_07830 [Clostridium sp.]|nr:hypothetical protein [Clostridium sp.]
MTTINCSSNCLHQREGKCMLDIITKNSSQASSDCAFFEEKTPKVNDKKT